MPPVKPLPDGTPAPNEPASPPEPSDPSVRGGGPPGDTKRLNGSGGGDRPSRDRAGGRTDFLGAMFVVAPLMPGLLAIVTVGGYLALTPLPWSDASKPEDPIWAIAVGLVVTGIVWLAGGFGAKRLVSARRAQARLYDDLLERCRSLTKRAAGMVPRQGTEATLTEANAQLEYVGTQLEGERSGPSLRWALATGYLEVLSSLHRAEEALIVVESTDAAVGDALHDALSIEDSTIDNRERLGRILRVALDTICPGTSVFLVAGTPTTTKLDEPIDEEVAREALREVRFAVNQYVEDKLGSLLRARNRLIWTMLAVGLSTYLLLALALAAAVPVPQILAVSVFYLVGAIVGLFNRLRLEVGRREAVEDFGLSMARLIVTPLLSGLAAVAGVYLVAVAPSLFPTGQTAAPPPPTLTDVFDLGTNAVGLVYAAIFGLAPNTLTNRLAAASARVEQEIASTGPSTGTSPHQD